MKEKLKNYKKYKKRNKEHELDLNNQANQMHGKLLPSELGPLINMKVVGN